MEINLNRKSLGWVFGICLSLSLVMPSVWPTLRILFFAPFLIMAIYQQSLTVCLWLGFLCGAVLDLLSSTSRLGIEAMAFCLAILIIHSQRRNFFADSFSTLPVMTFLFSFLSTAIGAILLYSIEMRNIMSIRWLITDLFIMPAADALYAFFLFIFPAMLFGKRIRKGKDYFS